MKKYILVLTLIIISFACSLPVKITINSPTESAQVLSTPQTDDIPKLPTRSALPPLESINYEVRFGIGGYIYPDIKQGEEAIYSATHEIDKLGMIWLRHPGRGISWYEVQPTRDSWNFSKLDAVTANNAHPWLLPVYGMVGNVYPFGNGFSTEHLLSLNGKEEVMDYIISNSVNMDDPQQRTDAEIYVKTFVSRYKDTVKHWEIGGNEGIGSPERFGIVKYTYQWIKEVDPSAVVILTANCGDYDEKFYEGISALENLLAMGAEQYFDIANMHYYGRVDGDFEGRLETRYDEFKGVLDTYGINKPIWITETSTSSEAKTFLSGTSSEALQAQHIVKRLVVFSAMGAEKVFWYNYGEVGSDDLFYGCNLMDKEDGPKPAYYTFRLLFDKIGSYKKVNTLRDDDVHLYTFINPDGSSVTVGWSDSQQRVDLKKYIDSEKVILTHIIEDQGQESPTIEQTPTEKVPLSKSPVFISATE